MKTNEKKLLPWAYFLVHGLTEVVCFSILYDKFGLGLSFMVAIVYDYFAFATQGLIGQLNNVFRKVDIASIGVVLMAISLFITDSEDETVALVGIGVLALGNAFLHEAGAIATTICSEGKLFPSALFVGGGSFGLIIGQTLGAAGVSRYVLLAMMVIIEVLVLATNKMWLTEGPIPRFALVKEEKADWMIILAAFAVTAVRSFIGYAIPISWKKELWQSFLLFFIMGIGKAAGGYLADKYGAKRVGVWSSLLSIPFLLVGNKIMWISIIGVFLFSLTMSITFGMLLSVIKNNPGLAFGVTTLALFVGMLPVLLLGSFGTTINSVLVVFLSLGSAYCLHKTLK